ncbi:phosphoribosyl-ATP diphosphatase [Candidatus Vidania fulgoroideae]|uniref:phosphoribosyl-ATP diphosphatase n=1 Tax=Candidatus Vidania fulgoroideorum TaxID=881286 RepID=A0AAX3NAJ5_9PROT|nr:phosphoribosyl-ATP diphosphatase [Candidatus Vidania fulgoroideae]
MKFIKKIIEKIKNRRLKKKKFSYISLIIKDKNYIKKKVMEEAYEFCNESKKNFSKKKFVNEFCDLLFHSLLLFDTHKVSFSLVKKEMNNRFKKKPV